MFNLDSDSSNSGSEEMYWSKRKIKWKQKNKIKWERRQKKSIFWTWIIEIELGQYSWSCLSWSNKKDKKEKQQQQKQNIPINRP